MSLPRDAAALAAAAATALAMGLAISGGIYDLRGLLLVTLAGVAALLAAAAAREGGAERAPSRAAVAILVLGIAASVVHVARTLPGITVDRHRLGAFRPLLAGVVALLGTYAWRGMPRWAMRARFPALVGLAAAMGVAILRASPEPAIDVWLVQQQGALALLGGQNPYALLYRNIYGPGTPFLDPAVLSPAGRFLAAYPYTPLTLLAGVPAAWLGDVRGTHLAAAIASAFAIRALGRGARAAELAALLLLLQPQGWVVLELSWTEPLVLAAILLLALAVRRAAETEPDDAGDPAKGRHAWLLASLAAALAVSAKQYVPLLALPFLLVLPARRRIQAVLVTAAAAAALVLPFLAADPEAFVRGVLQFQVRQPFRTDALSWPAAIASFGGPRIPPWPAFAIAIAVLAVTLEKRMTVAQALLASASTWIAFVACNKQAFSNYYWLGVGLLCAAVAALASNGASTSNTRAALSCQERTRNLSRM